MEELINGMPKLDFRTAINSNFTELDNMKLSNVEEIPENLLPPKSADDIVDFIWEAIQIKLTENGYFPAGTTPLAQSVVTFGTSTDTSNIINWTDVSNAVSQTLQYLNGVTWTDLYTGTLNTYTHTGLTPSTAYNYRVISNPDTDYSQSISDVESQQTAGSGGLVDVTDWTTSGGVTVVNGNDLIPDLPEEDTRAGSDLSVANGGIGYVQADSAGGRIALVDTAGSIYLGTDNEMWHAMFRNTNNGRISCYTRVGNVYYSDEVGNRPSGTLVRLRMDGVLVHYEFLLPGETVWESMKTATQGSFAHFIAAGLYSGSTLNVQQVGFS